MLIIFILFGIAKTFAQIAHDKNRNRYLWGTIGVLSYYLTQIIAGIIIALVIPEWLENTGIVMAINLISGFSGVGIAYFILNKLSDPTEELEADDDLLDSKLE